MTIAARRPTSLRRAAAPSRPTATALRRAQILLYRREPSVVADAAHGLLNHVLDDLAREPETVDRLGLPHAPVDIAAVAAAAGRGPALAQAAEQVASFEAFLADQRTRCSRHPGARGHVWGGRRGRPGARRD